MMTTRTKIVATLGPSSSAPDALESLMIAGADVFRLNFAHGTHTDHAAHIRRIRSVERRLQRAVGLLQDLPGPKIRVGALPTEGLPFEENEECYLASRPVTSALKTIPFPHPSILATLKPGHAVYIADGLIRLKVLSVKDGVVHCRSLTAGRVRRGNGVNLPDAPLSLPAFTRADAAHLIFGLGVGIDFVGLSFVSGPEDVLRARRFAARRGFSPFFIAKIERRQALKNLRAIVRAADGLMVARGDLGVEMPFSQIPGLQQDIIRVAQAEGKPVIVATQVLESMVEHPRPTRAEATDIAYAVENGVDALMLSGETSIGKYPLESVRALTDVIRATEERAQFNGDASFPVRGDRAFARAAVHMAESLGVSLLMTPVRTGRTAMLLSGVRSRLPIVAITSHRSMQRRLSLFRGLRTMFMKFKENELNSLQTLRDRLAAQGLARTGGKVALLRAANPPASATDVVRILWLPRRPDARTAQ